MDERAVKLLLETQERAFRAALEMITEQQNARIRIAEGTIHDLEKSLEFAHGEIKDLKETVDELRKTDKEKTKKIETCESRIRSAEDFNKRKNLRITGVSESPNETWENTTDAAQTIFLEKLQLPSAPIEQARRVGGLNRPHNKPRTIVVRLEKVSDRDNILRNARKLKGSGIYINEDLSAESMEEKMRLMPQYREARAAGKIAFFRQSRLIIKERQLRPAIIAETSGTAANNSVTAAAGGTTAAPGTASPAATAAISAAAGSVESRGREAGAGRAPRKNAGRR